MKNTVIFYIVSTCLIVLFVIAMTYAFRYLTAVSTPVSLTSPKAGVTCAYMTTSDNVAISCWKD